MLQNPATDLQVQRAQKGAGNSSSPSRSKAGKCVPVSHVNGGVLGPGSNRCVGAPRALGQEPRDRDSENMSFSAQEAIWEAESAFDWASVLIAVREWKAERARRDLLVRWTHGCRKKASGAMKTTSQMDEETGRSCIRLKVQTSGESSCTGRLRLPCAGSSS
jgi:hypothetical protein